MSYFPTWFHITCARTTITISSSSSTSLLTSSPTMWTPSTVITIPYGYHYSRWIRSSLEHASGGNISSFVHVLHNYKNYDHRNVCGLPKVRLLGYLENYETSFLNTCRGEDSGLDWVGCHCWPTRSLRIGVPKIPRIIDSLSQPLVLTVSPYTLHFLHIVFHLIKALSCRSHMNK